MPLYDFKCPCGKVFEVVRDYRDRDEPEACGCGGVAVRIPSISMISGDYPGYVSPATGKWVEGKRAHIEDLKRSGCRIYEKGETQEYLKNLPKVRKENEKLIDTAVENAARDIGLLGR